MKALIYDQHGGPEVLQYRDVPDPEPGPRDAVIKVAATTINYLDVMQRNGWFTIPGFSLPHISGMDVAGTVMETGSGVTRVKPGDRVLVNPSLSQVPDGSKLAGMDDLYGTTRRHRRQQSPVATRKNAWRRRLTFTRFPITCHGAMPSASPPAG